jgi:hypothetical protein
MRPKPRRFMAGSASRVVWKLAVRLIARIACQQVEAAELGERPPHHRFELVGAAHVGAVVAHFDAVRLRHPGAQALDLARLAEAVEDHGGPLRRERAGDAQPDARGRSGDEGGLAHEHGACSLVRAVATRCRRQGRKLRDGLPAREMRSVHGPIGAGYDVACKVAGTWPDSHAWSSTRSAISWPWPRR